MSTAFTANTDDFSTRVDDEEWRAVAYRQLAILPKKAFSDESFENSQPNAPTLADTRYVESRAEIIEFPKYKRLDGSPSEYMWALKEWDGYVIDIESDHLVALLSALGSDGADTERLEYPLDALSTDDRSAIKIGSEFRLSCGYTRKRTGSIKQQIALYFRPQNINAVRDAEIAAEAIGSMFKRAIEAPTFEGAK